MPAIDLREGMMTITLGTEEAPNNVTLDVYHCCDEFDRMYAKFSKQCEADGELPTFSGMYPIWAEAVTKVPGWSSKAAQTLHGMLVAEIEAAKKGETVLSQPGSASATDSTASPPV